MKTPIPQHHLSKPQSGLVALLSVLGQLKSTMNIDRGRACIGHRNGSLLEGHETWVEPRQGASRGLGPGCCCGPHGFYFESKWSAVESSSGFSFSLSLGYTPWFARELESELVLCSLDAASPPCWVGAAGIASVEGLGLDPMGGPSGPALSERRGSRLPNAARRLGVSQLCPVG